MENNKRNLQLKILEMVKYLDSFCKENQIEYYIIYGSCLGAVRHKGFIPWDDDFDVGMTLENYNKFISLCKTKLDTNKYFLQTLETEPNYNLSFAKLRDINTTLIEEGNKNIPITYGVYIDIFPIVGLPKGKLKRAILSINRAFALSANINVINNKFLYNIFRIILKIFGKKNILKYCSKQVKKYSCQDCEEWCSVFDRDGLKINSITKTIMGKPTYVPFEDIELPIPEKYDEYLKHIYGDYMKIPTPEQIKAHEHTAYILDLEHSYEEYKKINNIKE
ncbi:MAG: phosphorylcholine transferase LicD [Clostridia bacterium]